MGGRRAEILPAPSRATGGDGRASRELREEASAQRADEARALGAFRSVVRASEAGHGVSLTPGTSVDERPRVGSPPSGPGS